MSLGCPSCPAQFPNGINLPTQALEGNPPIPPALFTDITAASTVTEPAQQALCTSFSCRSPRATASPTSAKTCSRSHSLREKTAVAAWSQICSHQRPHGQSSWSLAGSNVPKRCSLQTHNSQSQSQTPGWPGWSKIYSRERLRFQFWSLSWESSSSSKKCSQKRQQLESQSETLAGSSSSEIGSCKKHKSWFQSRTLGLPSLSKSCNQQKLHVPFQSTWGVLSPSKSCSLYTHPSRSSSQTLGRSSPTKSCNFQRPRLRSPAATHRWPPAPSGGSFERQRLQSE